MPINFCTECRDETEYRTEETTKTRIIGGKELTFPVKMPYCKVCGAWMDVHEFGDYNLQMLDKAYRERECIEKAYVEGLVEEAISDPRSVEELDMALFGEVLADK